MKLILPLFFFISIHLSAQDYKLDPKTSKVIPTFQGIILLTKGQVQKKNKENPSGINLEKGQKIFSGDILQTMAASSIKFQMTDDTIIALGPNSSFEISKYEFQDKDQRQAVFNLVRGQLRAMIHRMAKVGDLEFRTPSIAMGVRGTEFLTNEINNKTQVALLSGKLEITTTKDQIRQSLQAGQHYIRAQDKIEIQNISPQELIRLKAEHVKEEDDFRPFLDLPKIPAPGPEITSLGIPTLSQTDEDRVLSQEDQWKKVLKQLNLRIKENNQQK